MKKTYSLLITALLAFVLVGCSSGTTVSPTPTSYTGTYNGTFEILESGTQGTVLLNIAENIEGTGVTGNIFFDSDDDFCLQTGVISESTINGFTVSLTVTQGGGEDGATLSIQMTQSNGGSNLDGTLVTSGSSTCSVGSGSGTINLVRSQAWRKLKRKTLISIERESRFRVELQVLAHKSLSNGFRLESLKLWASIGFLIGIALVSTTILADTEDATRGDTEKTNPIIRVYLAPLGENHQPSPTKQKQFQCSDQIFTVVELSEHPQGKHHLSVKWIGPLREIREHTQYSFNIGKSEQTKLWAWLELQAAAGSALLSWMNPAAGLEEFIGTWDVEVRINNRLVATRHFEVNC